MGAGPATARALASVARARSHRLARHRGSLAQARLPVLVALAVEAQASGNLGSDAQTHPPDGDGKPDLGRTTDPRRARETRHRDRRAHRFSPDAQAARATTNRLSGPAPRSSASSSPRANSRTTSSVHSCDVKEFTSHSSSPGAPPFSLRWRRRARRSAIVVRRPRRRSSPLCSAISSARTGRSRRSRRGSCTNALRQRNRRSAAVVQHGVLRNGLWEFERPKDTFKALSFLRFQPHRPTPKLGGPGQSFRLGRVFG